MKNDSIDIAPYLQAEEDFLQAERGGFLLRAVSERMMEKIVRECPCLLYTSYEVLYTREMSFEDLKRLKKIEALLEDMYNSGYLDNTIYYLAELKGSAFEVLDELAQRTDWHLSLIHI